MTGATGFIGSHLVKELLDQGYRVFAVCRPNSNNQSRLEQLEGSLEIVSCDLSQINKLAQLIPKANGGLFFHIGWEGVVGEYQSDYRVQMKNVEYSIEAIRVAHTLGCRKFIGAGSIHETECKKEMERCESIRNKTNIYKTAKLMAHYYCKLEAAELGIEFNWPRITNTYGAGECSARLINTLIRKLLSNESMALTEANQLYDFIYVTDLAKAFVCVGEAGKVNQDYILGSGEVKPLRMYLEELREVVNPEIDLRYGETAFNGVYLDYSEIANPKLAKDTNFRPEVSFNEGILLTKNYIKING